MNRNLARQARTALSYLTLVWALTQGAQAQSFKLGHAELAQADGGTTTLFYPTLTAEAPVQKGPFQFSWGDDAPPVQGNRRLIVISHGSGGSPWVHTDLARTLVERGFVVALPQHQADNYLDPSEPGPVSWAKRPAEVSHAIDAVAADASLARLLQLDTVGVFGGSAGGHTALTLAGGQWSFSRFRDHCAAHIEEDFSSCVGFTTLLHGNWLDGLKLWFARRIIASRFSDDTVREYSDPRIKAAVAMVPFAADFIPASLAQPKITLGLITAAKDVNQVPRFHGEMVKAACLPRCTVIMHLEEGGHGAMLSPLPPLKEGGIAQHLLSDPPGFDRAATLPVLHARIAEFFERTLQVKP